MVLGQYKPSCAARPPLLEKKIDSAWWKASSGLEIRSTRSLLRLGCMRKYQDMTTTTSGAQNTRNFPHAVARQLSTALQRKSHYSLLLIIQGLLLLGEKGTVYRVTCVFCSVSSFLVDYKSQTLSVVSGNEGYCWTKRNSYLTSSYLKTT